MSNLPVLIIGAGVSGLVLAQHLKRQGIPYQLFERDTSLTTRGVGWGLTLHWSLDALHSLIPDELAEKLPEAYADRVSVEKGIPAHAPYYDLNTGKLQGETPMSTLKVRVTRQRLRVLLSSGLDIQWGKAFKSFEGHGDSVTVTFDDGSAHTGRLLVGADGASSRLRRSVHPDKGQCYHLPIHLTGMKISCTPEQCEEMRKLDPYYLSGMASQENTYMFYSILDAPGSNSDSGDKYTIQVGVSWGPETKLAGQEKLGNLPESQKDRYDLLQRIAQTWSEPFRSAIQQIPPETDIQTVAVQDYIPDVGFRQKGRVTLVGDSVHAMAMFRGEGANHAIYDVYEFANRVTPHLKGKESTRTLRQALDEYEDILVKRTRPAVMASRRACLDAHDSTRVNERSPLFLTREPWVKFDEADME